MKICKIKFQQSVLLVTNAYTRLYMYRYAYTHDHIPNMVDYDEHVRQKICILDNCCEGITIGNMCDLSEKK